MSPIKTVLGSLLSPLLLQQSMWCAKMLDGRFVSERDWVRDGNRSDDPRYRDGRRPFDWSLDFISTGDVRKIKELWLLCPPNKENPMGQVARLPIVEPGTAFQLKIGFLDMGVSGTSGQQRSDRAAHIIGRVDDKVTGACTCMIWDAGWQTLSQPWHSSVYDFGTWRPEVAPLGRLSLAILGLSLG